MYWEIILIYIYKILLPTKSECLFCGASKVGRDVRWIVTTSLPTQYIGKSYQPTSNHKESSAGCWIIEDVKNLCPWTLTKSKHWSSDAFFFALGQGSIPILLCEWFHIVFFGQRHVFLLVRKTRRDWGCWHDEISDDVGDRSVGSIPDVPDDVPFFALESDKNGWFINWWCTVRDFCAHASILLVYTPLKSKKKHGIGGMSTSKSIQITNSGRAKTSS